MEGVIGAGVSDVYELNTSPGMAALPRAVERQTPNCAGCGLTACVIAKYFRAGGVQRAFKANNSD